MNKDVLFVVGSPKNRKGNSESLADYLEGAVSDKNRNTKVLLRKEIAEKEELIGHFDRADHIVISFPVYQNSVPGLVLKLFEYILAHKNYLENKPRSMIAISNSGFAETAAHQCAIEQCKLFSEQMGFVWGGGITVAPGTLIDGNDLSKTGKTYGKVKLALQNMASRINSEGCIRGNDMIGKPVMNPVVYRAVGRLIQKKTMKELGKKKYFQRPLL